MAEAKAREERPSRFLALFFGIFALTGLATAVFFCLVPLGNVVSAQGWEPLSCEVTGSRVVTHSDSDGTTYSIDIRYRYVVDGASYEGDTYDFRIGSSSGRSGKQAVVDRYPPGSTITCYVDPDDPTRSVIDREPGAYLLWGLFPLPFLAVGLGGMFWVLRPRRMRSVANAPVTRAPAPLVEGGPLELRADENLWGRVVGVAVFALIWDTICLIVFAASGADIFTLVFGGVFALVGVGLTFGMLPYLVGQALNPRPKIVISTGRLGVGTTAQVMWSLEGRASRVRLLELVLEGTEHATYRRGTNSVTDTHVFHEQVVATAGEGEPKEAGLGELTIPRGSMHSFASKNNKVVWRLVVRGDIPRWPDIDTSFVVDVHPFLDEEATP